MLESVIQRVAQGPLPMTFSAANDIDDLQVLQEGGWVKVTFTSGLKGEPIATVTELTPLGRHAMQFLRSKGD